MPLIGSTSRDAPGLWCFDFGLGFAFAMVELRVGDGDSGNSGNSGNCTGQGSLDKIKLPKIIKTKSASSTVQLLNKPKLTPGGVIKETATPKTNAQGQVVKHSPNAGTGNNGRVRQT